METLSRELLAQLSENLRHALDWIEGANGEVIVSGNEYPGGYIVPSHTHSRTQLLCVFAGVVVVEAERGRWLIPPGHALLIPPRLRHSVEMLSDVSMKSVYMAAAVENLVHPSPLVLEVTDLARSLLLEAIRLRDEMVRERKSELVLALLVEEISGLRPRPLGLPFPQDRRLAALCRDYVATPSPNARLDDWAAVLAMSRRTFTRFFRSETGVSFVTWRQQASVFACLPKLADGVPVTQVALDAGYESAAAFATMFRRVLGSSPRSYSPSRPIDFVSVAADRIDPPTCFNAILFDGDNGWFAQSK